VELASQTIALCAGDMAVLRSNRNPGSNLPKPFQGSVGANLASERLEPSALRERFPFLSPPTDFQRAIEADDL
jgi:hypothetical protein